MRAKWRLLILLGYLLFLMLQFSDIIVSSSGVDDILSIVVFVLVASLPVAILCLPSWHETALGCAAMLTAGFGIWAYHANDGDPIGLLIIVFYQFCITGLAFLAIALGAGFKRRWE